MSEEPIRHRPLRLSAELLEAVRGALPREAKSLALELVDALRHCDELGVRWTPEEAAAIESALVEVVAYGKKVGFVNRVSGVGAGLATIGAPVEAWLPLVISGGLVFVVGWAHRLYWVNTKEAAEPARELLARHPRLRHVVVEEDGVTPVLEEEGVHLVIPEEADGDP